MMTWLRVVIPTVFYNLVLVLGVPLTLRLTAGSDLRTRTSVFLGMVLAAELAALGILVIWLRYRGRSLADLGWGRRVRLGPVGLGIFVALLYAGFTLSSPVFGSNALELSWFKAWGALVGVVGGLVEETVFRGFVMWELDSAGVSPWGQVLASGVLFALIHGGFRLFWLDPVILTGMSFTLILGLALAGIYLYGGRSLTPPAIGHGLINLLLEPWLMMGLLRLIGR